jgi:hypothetical protein
VTYDYGARVYDARIGRGLILDPSTKKYPNLLPYNAFENNPIYFKDTNGKDAEYTIDDKSNTINITATIIITGQNATVAKAKDMQKQIMNKFCGDHPFTDKDGNTYNMKFTITVKTVESLHSDYKPKPSDNFVRLMDKDPSNDPSFVAANGWSGEWDENPKQATFAHETGHLLGLADRYWYVSYDNNLNRGEQFENVPNTDINDLMGLQASANPLKAKVTQEDINALGNYIIKNQKDGKGIIRGKGAPLNKPTEADKSAIKNQHGGEVKIDPRKKKE